MRIISIDRMPNHNSLFVNGGKGQVELYPVVITYKTWLGKIKTLKAYPTSVGPTFGSGSIIYYYFVDELGKEIHEDISKQINGFIKVKEYEIKN